MLVQIVHDQSPYQLIHVKLFHELQVIKMTLVKQLEYYQLTELFEVVVLLLAVVVGPKLVLVMQHWSGELVDYKENLFVK
jgi:hypothetical protein